MSYRRAGRGGKREMCVGSDQIFFGEELERRSRVRDTSNWRCLSGLCAAPQICHQRLGLRSGGCRQTQFTGSKAARDWQWQSGQVVGNPGCGVARI